MKKAVSIVAALLSCAAIALDYEPGNYANVRERAQNTLKYSYLPNRMFEKMAAGKLSVGGYIGSIDPDLCFQAGMAGLDFVWIDMEHRAMTVHDLFEMQTALDGTGCASLIRVRCEEFNHIKPILDIGVDGIIFPQIANYEAAVKAVEACRYPQAGGKRGICVGRQNGYGKISLKDFLKRSETWPIIIIELEDEPSIRDLDKILTLKDVDAIMVGPSDLACSMGGLYLQGGEKVQNYVDYVAEKTRKAGKLFFSLGNFDDSMRRGSAFYCGWGSGAGAWRTMKADLERRYANFGEWTGGSAVTMATANSAVKIDLTGANVVSLKLGGKETIWMPKNPGAPGNKWNHGGMPICWPWFGISGGHGKDSPHGFAKDFRFSLIQFESNEHRCQAALQLTSNEETKRIWPHDFKLTYELTLTDTLRVSLRTENTGNTPFSFTTGLHPYFLLGDRTKAKVTGVDGFKFCDSRVKMTLDDIWSGDLSLVKSLDHVFDEKLFYSSHSIVDPVLGRTISTSASGVSRFVVWAAGETEGVSSKPGSLASGDWKKFVCAEPAVLWDEQAIVLPPGARHQLDFEISVSQK